MDQPDKGSRDGDRDRPSGISDAGNWNGHAGTHAPENRPHGRGAARARWRPRDAPAARSASCPRWAALHEGHLSLMRAAAGRCGFVVVSLFVNPTQFGPGEDFERYPRDEHRDAALAAAAGVDLLFAPLAEEVYPDGFSTTVEVAGLTDVLCGAPGAAAPGHFTGRRHGRRPSSSTCAQPDVAYFGQKDFQQSLVIRRAGARPDIPVRIEVCPTVRDPDGLALSSRNAYLTPSRPRARARAEAARSTRPARRSQPAPPARRSRRRTRRARAQPGSSPEYVEVLARRRPRAPRGGSPASASWSRSPPGSAARG